MDRLQSSNLDINHTSSRGFVKSCRILEELVAETLSQWTFLVSKNFHYSFALMKLACYLNPSRLVHFRKLYQNKNQLILTLCGTSKGFMKAFKALIKPFEPPQGNVKIKI